MVVWTGIFKTFHRDHRRVVIFVWPGGWDEDPWSMSILSLWIILDHPSTHHHHPSLGDPPTDWGNLRRGRLANSASVVTRCARHLEMKNRSQGYLDGESHGQRSKKKIVKIMHDYPMNSWDIHCEYIDMYIIYNLIIQYYPLWNNGQSNDYYSWMDMGHGMSHGNQWIWAMNSWDTNGDYNRM